MLDQIAEVSRIGLVTLDVLSCVHSVETGSETALARCESRPAHVGQNDQLEVLAEVLQRGPRIGKHRPILNRAAEPDIEFRVGRKIELFRQALVHSGEHIRITGPWFRLLDSAFMSCEGCKSS